MDKLTLENTLLELTWFSYHQRNHCYNVLMYLDKLTLENTIVNHKIVSPLYKTECRLILVIIQYSPETNPGIVHLPAKTKPIYGEYKYLFRVFLVKIVTNLSKYLFSEV